MWTDRTWDEDVPHAANLVVASACRQARANFSDFALRLVPVVVVSFYTLFYRLALAQDDVHDLDVGHHNISTYLGITTSTTKSDEIGIPNAGARTRPAERRTALWDN